MSPQNALIDCTIFLGHEAAPNLRKPLPHSMRWHSNGDWYPGSPHWASDQKMRCRALKLHASRQIAAATRERTDECELALIPAYHPGPVHARHSGGRSFVVPNTAMHRPPQLEFGRKRLWNPTVGGVKLRRTGGRNWHVHSVRVEIGRDRMRPPSSAVGFPASVRTCPVVGRESTIPSDSVRGRNWPSARK